MVDEVKTILAEDEQERSYDTSDPLTVNKARKKAARTRADRLEFVKAAMTHEQGRAWFFDILNRCRVFSMPYLSGDTHGTSFRCGELNIGNQILADIIDIAPEQYIVMMKENRSNK